LQRVILGLFTHHRGNYSDLAERVLAHEDNPEQISLKPSSHHAPILHGRHEQHRQKAGVNVLTCLMLTTYSRIPVGLLTLQSIFYRAAELQTAEAVFAHDPTRGIPVGGSTPKSFSTLMVLPRITTNGILFHLHLHLPLGSSNGQRVLLLQASDPATRPHCLLYYPTHGQT
jgi:hypothetical protein